MHTQIQLRNANYRQLRNRDKNTLLYALWGTDGGALPNICVFVCMIAEFGKKRHATHANILSRARVFELIMNW